MTNDIGLVAKQAKKGAKALARAGLTLFRPYQFMNAQKVDRPEEIFDKLKGKRIIFEVKYDGARLQIHLRKKGRAPEIRFYSRRLNDDTAAMPDIASALARAWKGGDATAGCKCTTPPGTRCKKRVYCSRRATSRGRARSSTRWFPP